MNCFPMKISPHTMALNAGSADVRRSMVIVGLLSMMIPVLPAAAQTVSTKHVTAGLISDVEAIVPGRPFRVALRLEMEKGWHTYWKNPGDAGLATTIEWELPEGFTAGPILWPYPHRLGEPPEVSYGFSDVVVLPVDITHSAALRPGDSVTLRARAGWLVCNEICIAGKADLTLTLPVASGRTGAIATSRWSEAIREAGSRLPSTPSDMKIDARRTGEGYLLRVTPGDGSAARLSASSIFYAAEEGVIDHSGDQKVSADGHALQIVLPRSPYAAGQASRLRGVLVIGDGAGGSESLAIEIDVPIAESGG
jgi:DsbC/DsbD-like thiol-disulfide interchange protein